MSPLICQVYSCAKKDGCYVYMKKSDQPTEVLPEALREALGQLSPALSMLLDANKTLANADTEVVIKAIEADGFYVQMPPTEERSVEAQILKMLEMRDKSSADESGEV